MALVSVFGEWAVRLVCALVWLGNVLGQALTLFATASMPDDEYASDAGAGDAIARMLGIDSQAACHAGGTSSTQQGGGWKSAAALASSSSNASLLDHADALTWMKLLFVPALGLLLLAALLEEYCFAHTPIHAHNAGAAAAAGSSSSSAQPQLPPPTTILGWIRAVIARGPRLTTAYANQIKTNSLHASSSSVPLHIHHAHAPCTCGNSVMAQQPTALANGVSNGNPGTTSRKPSDPSMPAFAPMTLQLNFNGFNHLTGPRHYAHAFPREDTKATTKAADNSSPSSSTRIKLNGKPNGKSASPPRKAVGGRPLSPKSTSPSRSVSPVATGAVSPSSPTLTVASPSSPPASPKAFPPPASEFVPLTLVNESTGFRSTFSLWRHLTFGEILAYYVETQWKEEAKKYDAIEGGADLLAAEPVTPTTPNGANNMTDNATTMTKRSAGPPLMLRHQGTRISPLLTPASILPSMSTHTNTNTKSPSKSDPTPPVLEVCVDYYLLFDRHRQASHARTVASNAILTSTTTSRLSLTASTAALDAELASLMKLTKESQDKLASGANDARKLQRDVDKYAADLAALQRERAEVERTIESSKGLVAQQKAKLAEEYATLKATHAASAEAFARAKEQYSQALEERHETSTRLKHLMITYETWEKKLNTYKVHKQKIEKVKEKIRKLEDVLFADRATTTIPSATSTPSKDNSKTTTTTDSSSEPANTTTTSTPPSPDTMNLNAAARMKLRYTHLEQEHNVLNVQLNELRLASHEIDDLSKNEHYKLRYRLKLLEKDARDLAKWKLVARAAEADARESVRWKAALKEVKTRERALERDMREAHAWKTRARRLEKEVHDLRLWKRAMEGNTGADGTVSPTASTISTATSLSSGTIVPPPSSGSAPPGFEARTPQHYQQQQQQSHEIIINRLRSTSSPSHRQQQLHVGGDDLGPATTSTDDFLFRASLAPSTSSLRGYDPYGGGGVSSGLSVGVGHLNAGHGSSVLDADDLDLMAHLDTDDTADEAFGGANSPTLARWHFGSSLLNSTSPDMRPRTVGGVAGTEVAASAASPIELQEAEFTHTLPAFLAE